MNTQEICKIRPAGRHILTIGRELIQDCTAAIMELVKNAYDADSPDVYIEFICSPNEENYSIVVTDHGHGMTKDTVINKWMVPSTTDKLDRKYSPKGRTMQGRKGVGRYAVAILGNELKLETVTANGLKTIVIVNWEKIENAEYLDKVEIPVQTIQTTEPPGTRLTIKGDGVFLEQWTSKHFETLLYELKKLNSPIEVSYDSQKKKDDFSIHLKINGFPETKDINQKIEPFPLFDLFDYKITGNIAADGTGWLEYASQKARNIAKEEIFFNYGKPTYCGELFFDIRVYDRDKDAIESLISRGLTDENGNYIGKNQAKNLLNSSNGIGVYRNGFRIRPLGDPDFDWLRLNEERVQNPSLRIGSNQAIGFVQIQSEELSGLIEKSARDGLRENTSFIQLKEITQQVIGELETRRFVYRKKAGLSRTPNSFETQFQQLFSSEPLKREIQLKLSTEKISSATAEEINKIIDRENEEKSRVIDEIRQAVAIYQGQATIGKIINIILHEARRPLSYFRNQVPNLQYWCKSLIKTQDVKYLEKINDIADGITENNNMLAGLFQRLDPLAAGKRSAKKSVNIKDTILEALHVFDDVIRKHKIEVEFKGPNDFLLNVWPQDIYAIFTNLVDNSIYWMEEKNTENRKIIIELSVENGSLNYIDYRDTGPGIEPSFIRDEIIFEPQFSAKPLGTGLGLAIAGEAASRNNLELRAKECSDGAWFTLQTKIDNRQENETTDC